MQTKSEKNPEIAWNIPAAFLFVPNEPTPSPIALRRKNINAAIH